MNVIADIAESIQKPHLCNWEIMFGDSGGLAQYINLHDARQLINGYAYLSHTMRPTMVHLTIRWQRSAAFVSRDWLAIQGRLFDRMGRWLMRHGLPVAYLWTREMGRRGGPHTHLLLHLPPEHWARFMEFMQETGQFDPTTDATGTALHLSAGRFGMRTRAMQTAALQYLLKTCDPAVMVRQPAADGGTMSLPAALGIDNRGDDEPLPVFGKRVGVSYLLGPTMRRNYGWKTIHTAAELKAALHP